MNRTELRNLYEEIANDNSRPITTRLIAEGVLTELDDVTSNLFSFVDKAIPEINNETLHKVIGSAQFDASEIIRAVKEYYFNEAIAEACTNEGILPRPEITEDDVDDYIAEHDCRVGHFFSDDDVMDYITDNMYLEDVVDTCYDRYDVNEYITSNYDLDDFLHYDIVSCEEIKEYCGANLNPLDVYTEEDLIDSLIAKNGTCNVPTSEGLSLKEEISRLNECYTYNEILEDIGDAVILRYLKDKYTASELVQVAWKTSAE